MPILRMRERVRKLLRDTTAERQRQRPEVKLQPLRERRKAGRSLRERRKAGRKPLDAIAMTTAERVRKHRAAKKQLQALPPQERNAPGVVGSASLGPAASGEFFDGVQMSRIELLPAEAAPLVPQPQQPQPLVGPRYPAAAPTQPYAGYSALPIELRMQALGLPMHEIPA